MTKPIHRPPLARLAALLAAAALLALCAGCKTELDDGEFSDGFTARSACAYIAMLQESGTVKVTGELTEDDLTALKNAINGAADGVLVSLDLSGATGLTTIETSYSEKGAFFGCSKLCGITFPQGLTSIGVYAFYNCTALEAVVIPAGVIEIGWSAFSGCSALKELFISASVTSIGAWAFHNCDSLTAVTFADTESTWYARPPASVSGGDIEIGAMTADAYANAMLLQNIYDTYRLYNSKHQFGS